MIIEVNPQSAERLLVRFTSIETRGNTYSGTAYFTIENGAVRPSIEMNTQGGRWLYAYDDQPRRAMRDASGAAVQVIARTLLESTQDWVAHNSGAILEAEYGRLLNALDDVEVKLKEVTDHLKELRRRSSAAKSALGRFERKHRKVVIKIAKGNKG